MQTANLVKDIRMERFEKIDKGLQALEGPITVKLNNVSAMECNTIRHFFQGALNQFYKLAQVRTALHGSTIVSYHMSNLPPRLQQQALYWQISRSFTFFCMHPTCTWFSLKLQYSKAHAADGGASGHGIAWHSIKPADTAREQATAKTASQNTTLTMCPCTI